MTLIELVAAMSVIAIVMVGMGLTIAGGFRSVALTRQRQVAENAANKRLEEWRDVDYDQLALSSAPTHSTDPTYPDYFVSTNGLQLDVDGDWENLIIDEVTPGPVPHFESPVQVGTTVLDIYNFVSWVDDPAIAGTENLKRVTVMVRYRDTDVPGTARILRESVLFTPGTVTLSNGSTTSTSTTSTTVVTPTTTTTTTSTCGGFSLAGSSGAVTGYTATQTVTITMAFSGCGPLIANFSNDDVSYGPDVAYDPLDPTLAWALSSGEGNKTVYGKIRNGGGGNWTLNPQGIVLDTLKPTQPGTLARSVSCQGSTRTTTLNWGLSTDLHLVGYRLYRSTDGSTFQIIPPTHSGLSTSDQTSKTLTSVRYYVTAYDRAGNESLATNTITLSKNQCS